MFHPKTAFSLAKRQPKSFAKKMNSGIECSHETDKNFTITNKILTQFLELVKQKYQNRGQTQIFKASSLMKRPQPAAISSQK